MFFIHDDDGSQMDQEQRRGIRLVRIKAFLKKVLVWTVVIVIILACAYASESSASDAEKKVRTIDRQAVMREAIELYSDAHPEYTEEEIELIFRGITH